MVGAASCAFLTRSLARVSTLTLMALSAPRLSAAVCRTCLACITAKILVSLDNAAQSALATILFAGQIEETPTALVMLKLGSINKQDDANNLPDLASISRKLSGAAARMV